MVRWEDGKMGAWVSEGCCVIPPSNKLRLRVCRISTCGTRGSAEFVTRFWGRSGAFWRQHWELLTPDEAEPERVREVVPHGCFVDVRFGIEAYNFEGTRGLRHVAKSIAVHSG